MSYEIYWHDLTDEAQHELVAQGFVIDENIDMAPIAIIDQEEDD